MQIAERTRLYLDGVSTAITADVTHRRADGMIVTQALPFLRLDSEVTGSDGRKQRIARVAIAMDGAVPKLLLELRDEGAEIATTAEPRTAFAAAFDAQAERLLDRADGTRGFVLRQDAFVAGVSSRPPRADSTLPYEFSRSPSIEARPTAATAISTSAVARPSWWARAKKVLLGSVFGSPALPPS